MSAPSPVRVGDRPPPRTVGPVTLTDVVRFAGAGGDFNPLHHDTAMATAAGFERPIAMGQLTAGLLSSWLTDWCGVQNLRSFEVRFTAPLVVGETVEMSGEVTAVSPLEDDLALAEVVLAATRGDQTLVSGRATVVVTVGHSGGLTGS